jgi:ribosome-binding ATPase YchF (GTP1/OBG family)
VVRAYTIRRGHKVPVSAGVVLRTLGVVSAEC